METEVQNLKKETGWVKKALEYFGRILGKEMLSPGYSHFEIKESNIKPFFKWLEITYDEP